MFVALLFKWSALFVDDLLGFVLFCLSSAVLCSSLISYIWFWSCDETKNHWRLDYFILLHDPMNWKTQLLLQPMSLTNGEKKSCARMFNTWIKKNWTRCFEFYLEKKSASFTTTVSVAIFWWFDEGSRKNNRIWIITVTARKKKISQHIFATFFFLSHDTIAFHMHIYYDDFGGGDDDGDGDGNDDDDDVAADNMTTL